MRERYPDEMTVILQHQFWGLTVSETGFEVGLSFNNVPERLFVPFAAITMFQDPSVTFGLKFDAKEDGAPAEASAKPVVAADAPKGLALEARARDRGGRPCRPGSGTRAAPRPKPDAPSKQKPVLTAVGDKPAEDEADKAGGPQGRLHRRLPQEALIAWARSSTCGASARPASAPRARRPRHAIARASGRSKAERAAAGDEAERRDAALDGHRLSTARLGSTTRPCFSSS